MSTASPSPKIKGPTRREFLLGGAAALTVSGCAPETGPEEQARILRDELKIEKLPAIIFLAYDGCADGNIHNYTGLRNIVKTTESKHTPFFTYHLDMQNFDLPLGSHDNRPIRESIIDASSALPGIYTAGKPSAINNQEPTNISAKRLQKLGFYVNTDILTAHGSQMILVGPDYKVLAVGDSKNEVETIMKFDKALSQQHGQGLTR